MSNLDKLEDTSLVNLSHVVERCSVFMLLAMVFFTLVTFGAFAVPAQVGACACTCSFLLETS